MNNKVFLAWIGSKDVQAANANDPVVGVGPIAQAIDVYAYDHIHLLSDDQSGKHKKFVKWLQLRTGAKIHVHMLRLTSPTRHGEIYEGVISVLKDIHSADNDLTYHLSPGTPAMHSVWLLLAKTTYPARLIQSSIEAGVEEAEIPFDISAEFLPHLLQQSDRRLTKLAQGTVEENAAFSDIIHECPKMKLVISKAHLVAMHDIPVLIEGESGTGKEMMAKAIHNASNRAGKLFIPVNCGAIPEGLIESAFFGTTKGAFTGAMDHQGHFEKANGGTLFLDEIGELPKVAQVTLLRALQEGKVVRVGSSDEIKVDVRIIAATNRTLIDEVVAGHFREDLFYRLAVAIIKLPPIRERDGELSLLINKLLEKINQDQEKDGHKQKILSTAARGLMLKHGWPGNIREMNNTILRAKVWSDEDVIGLETMRDAIQISPKSSPVYGDILNRQIETGVRLDDLLAEVARHYLNRALDHTHNNKTQAATLLGLKSQQTITNWMSKYGIEK